MIHDSIMEIGMQMDRRRRLGAGHGSRAHDSARPASPGFGSTHELRTLFMLGMTLVIILGWWAWPKVNRKLDLFTLESKQTATQPPSDSPDRMAVAQSRAQALGVGRLGDTFRPGAAGRDPGPTASESDGAGSSDGKKKGEKSPRPNAPPAPGPASPSWADEARAEAREQVRFIPPSPSFETLEQLDREVLFQAMDDRHLPEVANNFKQEPELYYHVFRFIRSHGIEEFQASRYVTGSVEGIRQSERPLYEALTETPQTAAELGAAVTLPPPQAETILKRIAAREVANVTEPRFRRRPLDKQRLTEIERIVHKSLTEAPATPSELLPGVQARIRALPRGFHKGPRPAKRLVGLEAAVVSLLKGKMRTDTDLARELETTGKALNPVLDRLVSQGYIVPLGRPGVDRDSLREHLDDMHRYRVAERLPDRYTRGPATVRVLPEPLESVYFIIQQGQTSVPYLVRNLKQPEEQIAGHIERLLSDRFVKPAATLRLFNMISNPEPHRGQVVRFVGIYLRKYQLIEWEDNPSGVKHTWLVFVTDLKNRARIYAILTLEDPQPLERENDPLIELTGVFVKRWPATLPTGEWRWFPLIVAKEIKRRENPAGSVGTFYIVIGVITLAALVLISIGAHRDSRASAEARSRTKAMQKRNRERFRQRSRQAQGAGAPESAGAAADAQPGDAKPDSAESSEG